MKRRLLILLVIGLFTFLVEEYHQTSPLALPGETARLYSPQMGDNLEDTLAYSILHAKKSIVLITFTLKSSKIIQALNAAAEKGTNVRVVYDASASAGVEKRLGPKVHATARALKGLMHLKLLIIDGQHSWLGSSNITRDSLKSHANLMTHLDSPEFAKALLLKGDQISQSTYEAPIPPQIFQIENQTIELRFLPDDQTAVQRIRELIRGAKKSIQVAMFTFTREDFADDLIRAHKRGVKVGVIIDSGAANSSSKKIYELLKKNGVPVFARTTGGLMHHKFVIIDDEILEHGSANWTKAAFRRNDDYIMIITGLNARQKQALKEIWGALVD